MKAIFVTACGCTQMRDIESNPFTNIYRLPVKSEYPAYREPLGAGTEHGFRVFFYEETITVSGERMYVYKERWAL
jgi:hypothetical protein